jgi:hypothetical protein
MLRLPLLFDDGSRTWWWLLAAFSGVQVGIKTGVGRKEYLEYKKGMNSMNGIAIEQWW